MIYPMIWRYLILMLIKNWNGTISGLADEARFECKQGEFNTFKSAYEWYANNYTVNGKNISPEQLRNNYNKAKSTGKI